MDNQTLAKLGSRVGLFMKKNGPLLLSITSSAGVVVTGITSATGALKARQKLLEKEERKNDALTTKETLITATPYYILPFTISGVTIASIFFNHHLTQKDKAALIGVCTLLTTQFEEFKSKVNELYGENATRMVAEAINTEKAREQAPCFKAEETKLFYEPISGRLFERTENEVLLAEYHFNRNFALRDYACLNEFYEFLGLEKIPEGDILGWSKWAGEAFYGYAFIDFEHEDHTTFDGMEITDIVMPFSPTADYLGDFE